MDPDVLIAAGAIGYRTADRTILRDIELECRAGEIVSLIGPNGAGKTTLIRILLGLMPATSGSVYRREHLGIGYVPQKVFISRQLPLRVRDFLLLAGKHNDAELKAVLAEVAVPAIIDQPVQSISGGEFQRVLLARALLKNPDLLVLDEPAQGVDIIGQQLLYQTIATICRRRNCGVLMVSHDLHLVMASTDRVICLNTHVCCTGHPEHISEHPEYLKLFGSALEGLAVYAHDHDHEHTLEGDVVPHDHG